MWDSAYAEATLPARDIDRARDFYIERLGLKPVSEDKTGVHFLLGGSRFRLFRSSGVASGSHTQLALMVGHMRRLVGELKARGVEFEAYEYPNLKTVDGIADLGYAHAAWLKDSEGNLLGIAQLVGGGS
jgi:catechol 2,3-dioxygenase-like lactoylglutathione lyase family enzyme